MMRRLRQPRLAEIIAERYRAEILGGRLAVGTRLPRQDELALELGVSPAVVRESLRILETEDLITVHRGKVGGASIRAPDAGALASRLAQLLAGRGATSGDAAATLSILDAACARACAALPDRQALVERLAAAPSAEALHAEIARACGLQTLQALVETVAGLPGATRSCQQETTPERAACDHSRLMEAIAAGDAEAAGEAAAHVKR
jgi:DNA-binding FadR family transcriptional regulator